jgi:hypothetical protein
MFQLFVEGKGEALAAQKLVQKMASYLGLSDCFFSLGRRIPNLHTIDGLQRAVLYGKETKNLDGILILRDDEDNCPAEVAPKHAKFLRSLKMPFPIAYCILYREFETLFVAYADEFAKKPVPHLVRGQFNFEKSIQSPDNPEQIRGAKEWLTRRLQGRVYKPTTDQLSLTQAMDIAVLQQKGLACTETLERCIRFLRENRGISAVYPNP